MEITSYKAGLIELIAASGVLMLGCAAKWKHMLANIAL